MEPSGIMSSPLNGSLEIPSKTERSRTIEIDSPFWMSAYANFEILKFAMMPQHSYSSLNVEPNSSNLMCLLHL